jgi:hypothetical protein
LAGWNAEGFYNQYVAPTISSLAAGYACLYFGVMVLLLIKDSCISVIDCLVLLAGAVLMLNWVGRNTLGCIYNRNMIQFVAAIIIMEEENTRNCLISIQ